MVLDLVSSVLCSLYNLFWEVVVPKHLDLHRTYCVQLVRGELGSQILMNIPDHFGYVASFIKLLTHCIEGAHTFKYQSVQSKTAWPAVWQQFRALIKGKRRTSGIGGWRCLLASAKGAQQETAECSDVRAICTVYNEQPLPNIYCSKF